MGVENGKKRRRQVETKKNKRERSEENAKWERRGGEMEETASFSATDVRCAARQWLDGEEQETVGSL